MNHLLHQWIGMDRRFSAALALGTTTGCRLCRSFLLGLAQLDAQSDATTLLLVQRLIKTALLGRVEQRTVRRGPGATASHRRWLR